MSAAPAATRFVGTSVKRVEDDRILSGRGRYIDDIRLPQMLHGVFLRSSIAHGRLTGVDVEAALELEGVVAVITAAELEGVVHPLATRPDVPDVAKPVFTALASDRVRHVGDPIALILAETRYQAEDARDAIVVDYEPLETVASIEEAEDPARPSLFDDTDSNL
ncbi:MAG TPA: xanthine dehydrogenase family protein molybdopterin-binding subunit, partial [Solirubrobacteraceae bacterium]|nr:xanthine dehydrogenase family protein molybdopterin-binding subunit [Solirubrobacteraceae bacterium]